ncbi:hypothetical protein ILUMI_18217 [Ignelater luminosus]|uniref:Protein sleepless n=1 Tax=Ignelater luminosus TaxID=2038154 RepID=A0A8K0G6S3_IGNLU|nr:hypothetical protein ILUMI_18217 [Ignelater luminosus]
MAGLSLAFTAFILSGILHTGNSLQCYSCDSISSNLCEDPVNATLLNTVFCNQRNFGCLKQKLPAIGKIEKSVHRGCAAVAFCELLESVSDHCTVCTNDLCNSSSALIPSIVVLLLSSIFIFLFYKY